MNRSDRLGIIALESAQNMGTRVMKIINDWRATDEHLIKAKCPRFSSGEGKCVLEESVRDKDLYILVDVCNSSLTYTMDGSLNRMSPDDHFHDLIRVIDACSGRAERINVIMPFLYEGRQHRRNLRESLDVAVMLQNLQQMGIHSLITFDAHDPRMQAAVPLIGFENVSPALQFTQSFLAEYEDLTIGNGNIMFIAPDEGATARVVFLASLFGENIGMFYKRRDFTRIENGTNPIVAHDFCGESVEGKDCIVIDDMIASGGSMIDVAKQLKERGAKRVFLYSTFGLFTNGLDKFDKAYEEGLFDRIFTTNLIYTKPELLDREYYFNIHMERYVAAIIDTINKGQSLSELTKPAKRIKDALEMYQEHK